MDGSCMHLMGESVDWVPDRYLGYIVFCKGPEV